MLSFINSLHPDPTESRDSWKTRGCVLHSQSLHRTWLNKLFANISNNNHYWPNPSMLTCPYLYFLVCCWSIENWELANGQIRANNISAQIKLWMPGQAWRIQWIPSMEISGEIYGEISGDIWRDIWRYLARNNFWAVALLRFKRLHFLREPPCSWWCWTTKGAGCQKWWCCCTQTQ